jgi:hypothetical protein
MAHAYTPGLRITERAVVRKERRLPIAGTVLVAEGAQVTAETVVARAELPGDVAAVNVANQFNIAPDEIQRYMLKKQGDAVAQDEAIAETRPLIKWLRSVAHSPIAGTVETVSAITGQVMIRTAPKPVEVRAYVDGTVVEVRPGDGAVVETTGALVQGILGVGGEVSGQLAVVGDGPDADVRPGDLTNDMAGKIVVAGALLTSDLYRRAAEIGIAALIGGGIRDSDLRALLGYDLGVAVTGHEAIRPIVIVTEGFGRIPMARRTWDLLASHAGRRASASGATQIRAGVLRPEILIPLPGAGEPSASPPDQAVSAGLGIGSPVRIIREPLFGQLGTVASLPAGLEVVESEAKVRVVEVRFADGQTVRVPRANVEIIEA